MQANSQLGYVGFRVQDSKGVFKAPALYFKVQSGALGSDTELIEPDPEIGGIRDKIEAYAGGIRYSGSYSLYMRPEDSAVLLYGALGAVSVSGNYGGEACAYRHRITPANTLPWLSVRERVGGAGVLSTFDYTDVKVNSWVLECEGNGLAMVTAELIGITQSGNTVDSTPVDETAPILNYEGGIVTLEGSAINVKSLRLEINNNLEDDDWRIGSRKLIDLPEHRRELAGALTLRPEDASLYWKAVNGGSTAKTPSCNVYSGSLEIYIRSCHPICGGVQVYSIDLNIPKVYFKPFRYDPSGDDMVEHTLELLPVKITGSNIITADVITSLASLTA